MGIPLNKLSKDDPDFLLHGPAMMGRTQPQIGFDAVVELSDGQAGHGQLPMDVIAMLSLLECIAITIV